MPGNGSGLDRNDFQQLKTLIRSINDLTEGINDLQETIAEVEGTLEDEAQDHPLDDIQPELINISESIQDDEHDPEEIIATLEQIAPALQSALTNDK